eukprot:11170763-Lingulodinium_polyedra.AAC.1
MGICSESVCGFPVEPTIQSVHRAHCRVSPLMPTVQSVQICAHRTIRKDMKGCAATMRPLPRGRRRAATPPS